MKTKLLRKLRKNYRIVQTMLSGYCLQQFRTEYLHDKTWCNETKESAGIDIPLKLLHYKMKNQLNILYPDRNYKRIIKF
jgi:hypothetical protein